MILFGLHFFVDPLEREGDGCIEGVLISSLSILCTLYNSA